MPIVYMATNAANGKRYIGVTKFSLKRRKGQHIRSALSYNMQFRFYHAIRKYGAERFSWTILREVPTQQDALELEKKLVEELKPEYNATAGGGGTTGCIHKAWNKKKILCLEDGLVFESATAAAKFYSVGVATLSMSANPASRRYSAAGRHFRYHGGSIPSEEERQKVIDEIERTKIQQMRRGGKGCLPVKSKDRLGRPATGSLKRCKPVLCVTTGKTFSSATDAAHFYNVNRSSLMGVCCGLQGRKTAGGLVFRYIDQQAA